MSQLREFVSREWDKEGICHGNADAGELAYAAGAWQIHFVLNYCDVCPVINECLEWALSHDEVWGVWGGKTTLERQKILRARKRQQH